MQNAMAGFCDWTTRKTLVSCRSGGFCEIVTKPPGKCAAAAGGLSCKITKAWGNCINLNSFFIKFAKLTWNGKRDI